MGTRNSEAGGASSSPKAQHPSAEQTPAAGGVHRPTYAAGFRCIGADCEDTCCSNWAIPLDKETYRRYREFPPDRLGSVVSRYVSLNASPAAPAAIFARILPAPSGCCPFFGADRLCAVHKEYGADLLSSTCSSYPRALNSVDGVLEGSLMLSCPEAARNVLLAPDATEAAGNLFSGEFRTDNALRLRSGESGPVRKPYGHFHAIRSLLIEMVQDRSRPLWRRLLFIGSLCKSLDEVDAAQEGERVPAMLANHRRALVEDALPDSLESIPAQPRVKLGVILKLTDARVQDKESGARFMDTFWTFVEGIGAGMDAAGGDDIRRYLEAEQRYHQPFFARFPFMLENYLLNYIFQNLFPFGREGNARSKPLRIFDEYVLLAAQFAWINTLLVGVAGRHGEAFSGEHVVEVVQSFCRAVEHNASVLLSISQFMARLHLDTLEGMAVMLKS